MNKKTITWLVVLVLLIIGGVAFAVYYAGKSPDNGATSSAEELIYKNTDYGFTFSLPNNWQGYSVIQDTWQGTALTSAVAPTGPKLIIRNPKWTEAAHYEDIPILVFTIVEWNSYTAEDFSVSAAPIQASELARNSTYVFALPPRWDFDYSLGYEEAENIIAGKPLQAFDNEAGIECHSSSKYFAIQKSLAPDAGSDILIKYKTNPDQNLPCTYKAVNGDFEIKNVMAQYFLTFTDNFLVLDQGTAPEPRGLVVYDLRSHKIAFNDSYAKPVEVVGDSITYLSETDQKPTLQNCPDLNNYTKNGLGAVIMSKVTVDLSSLNKKDLGITECRATQ
jgi:hypothetical protein